MHKVADKDGYIMVTWANNHYYDFVKNWVAHVEGLGITSFVIGAMDNIILAQLLKDGIPCFSMQSGLTANDYGWGSPSFHKMVRHCLCAGLLRALCCRCQLFPRALELLVWMRWSVCADFCSVTALLLSGCFFYGVKRHVAHALHCPFSRLDGAPVQHMTMLLTTCRAERRSTSSRSSRR